MPTVAVSEETYQRLADKAAALNVSVDELVRPVLDQLAASERIASESTMPLTGEAWEAAMADWKRAALARAERYPPGFVVDASRETIYREREDAQR